MILPYQKIKPLLQEGMLTPWFERTEIEVRGKKYSYGLGPAGYDVRIAQDLFLEPGQFLLCSTIEKFAIPNHILAQVCDKSSWARQGICVQNTIIEPGWGGYLTLEITNHISREIEILPGMPIAQIIFMQLSEPTEFPYNGKYQNQPARPIGAI